MKKLGTLLLIISLLTACEEKNSKKYQPESIGALNTLAVVMSNSLWEGEVGDEVRKYFAAPVPALTFEEPLFSIDHMPRSVFTGTTRYRRLVLFVERDSLDLAHIKKDLYAAPQNIAVIKGRTNQEIIENIASKAPEIIANFRNMEIEEAQQRFLRSVNKNTILEEKFGISLRMPSLYKVGRDEENFVWLDRDIPKGTLNLLVYTMPLTGFDNDSTLVGEFIAMRDSIGQEFIPGPDVPGKITHMITERAFAPYIYSTEINGEEVIEARGIWEVKNFPMAGPFLTYIIDDEENNRKIVLEGFTFAPSTSKRDYMFELEAIMRSIKIKESR